MYVLGMHIFIKKLIDIIFPKRCISCDTEGSFLCNDCFKKIKKYKNPVLEEPHDPFKKIIIPCPYHRNPILSKAIHRMKYSYYKDLSENLSALLSEAFKKISLPQNTHIVPIPLHKKRKSFRGFNQSVLLAQNLNIPIIELLIREKETRIQASLKRNDRLHNLQGAFEMNYSIKVPEKDTPLLILDDICTTFTTVTHAAKVLQKNGYNVLLIAALARA